MDRRHATSNRWKISLWSASTPWISSVPPSDVGQQENQCQLQKNENSHNQSKTVTAEILLTAVNQSAQTQNMPISALYTEHIYTKRELKMWRRSVTNSPSPRNYETKTSHNSHAVITPKLLDTNFQSSQQSSGQCGVRWNVQSRSNSKYG